MDYIILEENDRHFIARKVAGENRYTKIAAVFSQDDADDIVRRANLYAQVPLAG